MPKDRIDSYDVVRNLVEKFKGGPGQSGAHPSLSSPASPGSGGPPTQTVVNPMAAIGDMIRGGTSGAMVRLAGGAVGKILRMTTVGSDVIPQWSDESAATVDSVNGQTGTVVLDADDISDSGTAHKFTTAADITKLAGIEAGADVTDAANVDAAGAVMNSDTSTAAMSFVIDEDSMATNTATKIPTQQSVKAYVDAQIGGVGSGAPTGATYITQTHDATLSAEQALGDLSTGLLKVTTTTGVLSTAAAADLPTGIDATKIADGTVTNTEFQYINSLTSNVQTQINALGPGGTYYLGGILVPWVPARAYDISSMGPGTAGNAACALDTLFASPWCIAINTTITELAVTYSTGLGGASVRLGIYASGTDGFPGALLLDAGTVSIATGGQKTITGLSFAVTAGTIYWMAMVASGTANNARWTLTQNILGNATNNMTSGALVGVSRAFTYATLPNPWGTHTTEAANPVRIAALVT